MVLAVGRVTNPAESRYSPIEGDCLAIADAPHIAKHYVLGCNDLLLATGYKPLVGVFAKSLEDIENPRLLSIAEKTMWFKFKTIHVPSGRSYSWHLSNIIAVAQRPWSDRLSKIGKLTGKKLEY